MKKLVLCLLLAGCVSSGSVTKPVTVEMPVPVPCRAPVVLHPVWPTESLPENGTLFEHVRAMLAENELRQAYEIQLEAAIKACQ